MRDRNQISHIPICERKGVWGGAQCCAVLRQPTRHRWSPLPSPHAGSLQRPAQLTPALQGGLSLCSSTAGARTARGLHRLRTARCAATGKGTASVKAEQQRQRRIFHGKQTEPKPQQLASVYSLGSGEKNPSATHLKRSPNLLLR